MKFQFLSGFVVKTLNHASCVVAHFLPLCLCFVSHHAMALHQGRLVDTCVEVSDGSLGGKCQTRDGHFGDCVPSRKTISGGHCSFPALLNGNNAFDCTESDDGIKQCRTVTGMLEDCVPTSTGNPETVPTRLTLAVINRVTIDGEQCIFPFWHKGGLKMLHQPEGVGDETTVHACHVAITLNSVEIAHCALCRNHIHVDSFCAEAVYLFQT